MTKNIFDRSIKIPTDAEVIFVSDMFVEDYVGGAELTSQALIDASPLKVFKLHSSDVTMENLSQGSDKFWIFGNFAQMNLELIPSIVGNSLKYAILEYDYKFCKHRSPEKHASSEGKPCDCQNDMHGKMISAFYFGSRSLWWMSEKQRDKYLTMFPFLEEKQNTVLSSVFDDPFFVKIKMLRDAQVGKPRKGWIVLGSNSWIKGQDDAVDWCKKNNKEYEIVWNLPYFQLLEKLAQSEGLIYLPKGGDTCPRLVIEAKLLGCKLQLNDNVQHKDEIWFSTDDIEDTESYLFLSRSRFWAGIKSNLEYNPTLSGYTTTYNCVSQGYPFEQSIQSMLEFCDEVCVVDGGSNDGTWEKLIDMVMESKGATLAGLNEVERTNTIELCKTGAVSQDGKLRIKQISRDWNHPRFAVFDGLQKAEARKMCTGDFCWQQDSDEIVHSDDYAKVRDVMKKFPVGVEIVALPVVEFWGGADKLRIDITPWKWRLSKNNPDITHGIPKHLRLTDTNGDTYAQQGTDGCDMISVTTGEPISFGTFYTPEVELARRNALNNEEYRKAYEAWMKQVTSMLPTVQHYSWWHLDRKIKTYRGYWAKHWKSLFDITVTDTVENNMMFDKPWSEVTDDDITVRAQLMKEKLGGWVWHAKWNGVQTTPHMSFEVKIPDSMKSWCEGTK